VSLPSGGEVIPNRSTGVDRLSRGRGGAKVAKDNLSAASDLESLRSDNLSLFIGPPGVTSDKLSPNTDKSSPDGDRSSLLSDTASVPSDSSSLHGDAAPQESDNVSQPSQEVPGSGWGSGDPADQRRDN